MGWRPADLVRKSHLSAGEVSRWESGKAEVPRTERVRLALAKAFELEPVTLGGYLDGLRPFGDLFPPPATTLDQALTLAEPGHWSEAAVAMAKEAEAQLGKKGKDLSVLEWVQKLDASEEQVRSAFRTVWQRLLGDDIIGDE